MSEPITSQAPPRRRSFLMQCLAGDSQGIVELAAIEQPLGQHA